MPHLEHLAKSSPRASKTRSFLIGMGQMFLMTMNIRNMADGHLVFLTVSTVINTLVWVWIVRTTIHSTRHEIWAYAVGSSLGANVGVVVHHFFLKPLAFTHLASLFNL